jgi:AcrR family transcriptional regulator
MRTTESATSARRAQGERSRERLIEAAIQIISERGFAAASVGDICREAGVAKTALYWHFDNKEGLLAKVLERVGENWIAAMRERTYLVGEPPARLAGLIDAWREILQSQPQLIRLPLLVQLGIGETSDSIREALGLVLERARRALIAGIEDSLGDGLRDLEMVAQIILTLFQGALLHQVMHPEQDEELERILAEVHRTIALILWDRLPDAEKVRLPIA